MEKVQRLDARRCVCFVHACLRYSLPAARAVLSDEAVMPARAGRDLARTHFL